MTFKTIYYVWRRNDGYINSSCYMPKGHGQMDKKGASYELLGTFQEWTIEVVQFIEDQRDKYKDEVCS